MAEGGENKEVDNGINQGLSAEESLPLLGSDRGGENDLVEIEKSDDGDKKTRKTCCGFPPAIFFILGNEFCERFSYYGMKGILVIYLTTIIGFSDNDGSSIAHGFNMICMGTPLIGSIIADQCWGRYKTIWVISLIYVLGHVVLTLSDIPALGAGKGNWYGPILGLVIIGFGTGGIKPNVVAFGGDQFDESNSKKSETFFSLFYAAINSGSLISIFVTPYFKGNVQCFGGPCYMLAFGVPAILMALAVILFVCGGIGGRYVKVPPTGSIVKEACKCVCHALKRRCREQNRGNAEQRSHWLDWADDKFSPQFIADVKSVLNVFKIFAPLSLFWALYDQQGTYWVIQSLKMDASIGSWVFQPEQMQVLNPILILTLIPIFDFGVYPLIKKCKCKETPLRRIGVGLLLAGVAFLVSGCLEKAIEDLSRVKYPSAKQTFISIFNAHSKPIKIGVKGSKREELIDSVPPNGQLLYEVVTPPSTIYVGPASSMNEDLNDIPIENLETFDPAKSRIVVQYVPTGVGDRGETFVYFSTIKRPEKYKARMSVHSTIKDVLHMKNEHKLGATDLHIHDEKELKVDPGSYSVKVGTEKRIEAEAHILNGAIYAIAIFKNDSAGGMVLKQQVILEPYSLSVFLQVPQILIITVAEIMVSITGLSFAYSQAPISMKSIVQAGWLLTIFFGNLIDVIIFSAVRKIPPKIFPNWALIFCFAGLIFLATIPFILLARKYKYVDNAENSKNIENVEMEEEKKSD